MVILTCICNLNSIVLSFVSQCIRRTSYNLDIDRGVFTSILLLWIFAKVTLHFNKGQFYMRNVQYLPLVCHLAMLLSSHEFIAEVYSIL